MARSRNIKPGFFQNEELVELPYEYRLLFIGLWMLADREGRLEDRPKKIKMSLFPADEIDIDKGLSVLGASNFVLRYEINNNKYIQILNFTKHQRPHHQEVASKIPPPDLPGYSPNLSEEGASQHRTNPPDTLNPITDTLEREAKKSPSISKNGKTLPKDWVLPNEWKIWTETNCQLVDPETTAEEFRDWAHGNSNRAVARKADWFATWRNWCRRDNDKYKEQEKWARKK